MEAAKSFDDYDISDEKFLMGFSSLSGLQIGTITLGRYCYENLNTTTMLFADIDIGDPQLEDGCLINSGAPAIAALKQVVHFSRVFPERKPSYFTGILNSFFGGVDAKIPMSVYSDIAFKEDLGFRVYRTKGGLRIMCATHAFLPNEADEFMRFIYTDPRYRRLCKKQGVFRARIMPKKWRLISGCEDEAKTCEYVETIGSEAILPEFDRMVAYHDRVTGAFKKGGYLA